MKYLDQLLAFVDKYNYMFTEYAEYLESVQIQPFTFIIKTNYYELNFMGEIIWNSEDYGEFLEEEVVKRIKNIISDLNNLIQ